MKKIYIHGFVWKVWRNHGFVWKYGAPKFTKKMLNYIKLSVVPLSMKLRLIHWDNDPP